MTERNLTIGICGVGAMGRKASICLAGAEQTVFVYDPYEAAIKRLESEAAEHSDRIQAVDRPIDLVNAAGTVLLFLPGPKETRKLLTDAGGLFETLQRPTIFADMGTIGPDFTIEMNSIAVKKGFAYLDAPILGRPQSVGKWVIPVGGDEKSFNTIRRYLEILAAGVIYAGSSGSGNRIKLLNQMMFGAINAASAEIMALADRMGVSKKLFVDTIHGSSAATVSALFKEIGKRVVENHYSDPTFTIDLLEKDVRLALEMAQQSGSDPELLATIHRMNTQTRDKGFGNQDTAVMWKALQRVVDS